MMTSQTNTLTTPEGLLLTPHPEDGPEAWRVEIVRELPQRLGTAQSVDIPRVGAVVAEGEMLVAIELSKARVEFPAPFLLVVSRSDAKRRVTFDADSGEALWHLIIHKQATNLPVDDSSDKE